MTANIVEVREVPRLPRRAPDAHKGSFGRVLVVAGNRGMSGAAVLCATSSLRGGAGLVRLAVPRELLPIVAAANPCYMTVALEQNERGALSAAARDDLLEAVAWSTVTVLGPGLGQGGAIGFLLRTIFTQTATPLVLDADALNALAEAPDELLSLRRGPTVLTPHPGEFGRLIGCGTAEVQVRRRELAIDFARRHGVVVVLKGHGTVVTDGKRVFVNTTGNPGMATGGSGDVLTGLIGALLVQGLEPFGAAQLGVHVHGRAGDLAAADLGMESLIASDLLDHLPAAFQR
jgi:ADP-dependent NAD(P)H-hydrate dehydratase